MSFDASGSSDSDGHITSYQWAFGDGNTGSGVITSHTYTTASSQSYYATLTVIDNRAEQATKGRSILVTAVGSPLRILDGWQLVNDGVVSCPWRVNGYVRVGDDTLSYAEVRANFYDASGTLLCSAVDIWQNPGLPANTSAQFSVHCLDLDMWAEVHHATVSVGTCARR